MTIKRSRLYQVCNIICFITLIAVTIFLFIYWKQIPDQIAGHYSLTGDIDKLTGKSSLYILLFGEWMLILGITILERFPRIWNTGVTITAANKEHVYCILSNMIVVFKMMLSIWMSYLIIHTVSLQKLPLWFTVSFLASICCPMIISLLSLYRAK